MEHTQAVLIADEIIALYEKYGEDDYIGEPVSQLEHMCQCAQLAEKDAQPEDVILAAFFHDIGHFCEHLSPTESMDGFGTVDHEKLGQAYLVSKGFDEKIGKLVASHVNAKRYLTYRDPGYYSRLSDASRKTLEMQGGMMNEEEALAFEQDPLFEWYIKLRQWDEQAKLENRPLPPLQHYREMMIRNLKN